MVITLRKWEFLFFRFQLIGIFVLSTRVNGSAIRGIVKFVGCTMSFRQGFFFVNMRLTNSILLSFSSFILFLNANYIMWLRYLFGIEATVWWLQVKLFTRVIIFFSKLRAISQLQSYYYFILNLIILIFDFIFPVLF